MGKSTNCKKSSLIWIGIILLAAVTGVIYGLLWSEKVVLKNIDSTEVIHKLKNVQDKGGEFELTQKDIDEITSLYFGNPKVKGDLSVKGVNAEILNEELLLKAPVSYKKTNLLFSSKGKLTFSNGEIIYEAENFKVGKVILPKSLVISKLSKLQSEKIYVEDGFIKLNPNVLPFKLTALKITDNKILGVAEKLDFKMLFENIDKKNAEEIDKQLKSVDEKIQSAIVLMNKEEKAKAEEIQNTIGNLKGQSIEKKQKAIKDAISKLDKAIGASDDKEKKKKLEQIKKEVEKVKKDTEEKQKQADAENDAKRQALSKIESELSGAYGGVQTSKEQEIISIMLSTVNKMRANTSYDSSGDQATVKSIYKTLDPESRNRVKGAIFSSVGGDSIGELRQAFGL